MHEGEGPPPPAARKESGTMLVLSRKLNESIVIDGDIRITVVGLRGNQVRIGIEAPGSVGILREELLAPASAERTRGRREGVDAAADAARY
jgi:carbon storage regulator